MDDKIVDLLNTQREINKEFRNLLVSSSTPPPVKERFRELFNTFENQLKALSKDSQ